MASLRITIEVNSDTKAIRIAEGRRRSQNMPPVAGSHPRRARLGATGGIGVNWEELTLVNDVRGAVSAWREADYPGVTSRTRELLRFWTDRDDEGENEERGLPLYFAQLDAALSHIYLKECDDGGGAERIAEINGKYNNGIERLCHKMATGSGKTLVMAMLIIWQTANKIAYPDDARFTSRFLCLTPGITVKERLTAALTPNSPADDYEKFYLPPPGDFWEGVLGHAAVYVVNSQQLKPKSALLKPSTTARVILNGDANPMSGEEIAAQEETMEEVIASLAGSADERIMVINDESHHCHNGDPNRSPEATDWFARGWRRCATAARYFTRRACRLRPHISSNPILSPWTG